MPLLDSPRLSATDRAFWALQARNDAQRGRSAALARKAQQARELIAEFLGKHPGAFVSVSWGKDSVVVAHLVRQVNPDVLLVHVTHPWLANPCALQVRDAFLAEWPMPYAEHLIKDERKYFKDVAAEFGDFGFRGIRAQESKTRRLSAYRFGEDTGKICRPVLWWKTHEIFAYHERHGLPLSPVYAMSRDGQDVREFIRTDHVLGPDHAMDDRILHERLLHWCRRYFPESWEVDAEGRSTKRLPLLTLDKWQEFG